jgi:hypothetical protein
VRACVRAQMKIEEVDNGDKVEITTVGQKEELERFVQVCVRGCMLGVHVRACASRNRAVGAVCSLARVCSLSLLCVRTLWDLSCARAMISLLCVRAVVSVLCARTRLAQWRRGRWSCAD